MLYQFSNTNYDCHMLIKTLAPNKKNQRSSTEQREITKKIFVEINNYIFENLSDFYLKNYKLDPAQYYTSLSFPRDAMLRTNRNF